jgi:hypothetical protein
MVCDVFLRKHQRHPSKEIKIVVTWTMEKLQGDTNSSSNHNHIALRYILELINMKVSFSSLCIVSLLPAAAAMSIPERAQGARSRLFEALRSPSGKLTLSPEIIVPDPTDPTSILLLATGITGMSEKLRVQAKANTVWVSGAVTSLKTFCSEQEASRGSFPGPTPVVYCDFVEDLASVSDAGADGILVLTCGGEEITSMDDLAADAKWVETCKAALLCGLQPIPAVTISDATAASWKEADIEALVSKITELSGDEPVSILLTVNPEDEDQEVVSIPTIPKALGRKIPIIGSVRVAAGENRMGVETARFKEAGYTGALLRSDCMPGFRMNMDLDFVGTFWSACIGDLKSLKSKNFNFQSRNWMDKSQTLEWAKYQQSVISSGALGDPASSVGLDPDAGDYSGF